MKNIWVLITFIFILMMSSCSSECTFLGIPYEDEPVYEYSYNPAYPSDYETIDKLIQKHNLEGKIIDLYDCAVKVDGNRYVRYVRYQKEVLYVVLDDGNQYTYDQITRTQKRKLVNSLIFVVEGSNSGIYYSIKEKER